jgi:hypothetical protein
MGRTHVVIACEVVVEIDRAAERGRVRFLDEAARERSWTGESCALRVGSLEAPLTLASSAFGSLITFNCTPTAVSNSITVGSPIDFMNASGTGSSACTDASLGAVVLNSVSVNIFTDYSTGNGSSSDPLDNSAGFTFSNTTATWAVAHPGAFTSTMSLSTSPGVTLFVIGNASSSADTFTNTTSGGLAGTSYVEPATNAQTGTLAAPPPALPFRGHLNASVATEVRRRKWCSDTRGSPDRVRAGQLVAIVAA